MTREEELERNRKAAATCIDYGVAVKTDGSLSSVGDLLYVAEHRMKHHGCNKHWYCRARARLHHCGLGQLQALQSRVGKLNGRRTFWIRFRALGAWFTIKMFIIVLMVAVLPRHQEGDDEDAG